MYLFKTTTGNIKTLLIDGYEIGDIVLENIFIGIQFNQKGNLIAFITEEDKENLKGIDYEYFILDAQLKALEAINNKDFDFFYNSPNILDIIDNNNFSYYKRKQERPIFLKFIKISCSPISIKQFVS